MLRNAQSREVPRLKGSRWKDTPSGAYKSSHFKSSFQNSHLMSTVSLGKPTSDYPDNITRAPCILYGDSTKTDADYFSSLVLLPGHVALSDDQEGLTVQPFHIAVSRSQPASGLFKLYKDLAIDAYSKYQENISKIQSLDNQPALYGRQITDREHAQDAAQQWRYTAEETKTKALRYYNAFARSGTPNSALFNPQNVNVATSKLGAMKEIVELCRDYTWNQTSHMYHVRSPSEVLSEIQTMLDCDQKDEDWLTKANTLISASVTAQPLFAIEMVPPESWRLHAVPQIWLHASQGTDGTLVKDVSNVVPENPLPRCVKPPRANLGSISGATEHSALFSVASAYEQLYRHLEAQAPTVKEQSFFRTEEGISPEAFFSATIHEYMREISAYAGFYMQQESAKLDEIEEKHSSEWSKAQKHIFGVMKNHYLSRMCDDQERMYKACSSMQELVDTGTSTWSEHWNGLIKAARDNSEKHWKEAIEQVDLAKAAGEDFPRSIRLSELTNPQVTAQPDMSGLVASLENASLREG